MLVHYLIKRFVKVGTLHLIDAAGNVHHVVATPQPEITLHLHTKSIEHRLCYSPDLAVGEGYMEGEITIDQGDIYDFLYFIALNQEKKYFSFIDFVFKKMRWLHHFFHAQNPIRQARRNVAHHYDLSEDLYRLFLDEDLHYSCAYFKTLEDDLETAQKNKDRHLMAKLRLLSGQKVLDIGCGWGELALMLAREANVEVVGLTLSEEQYRVASARAKQEGLADRVRFYLKDYRQERGVYNRIVSVGMFEHVGVKHYKEFFAQVRSLLKEDGMALLHSIGSAAEPTLTNPWIKKYIFPGGYIPSLSEVLPVVESSKLYVSDIEILYRHYAETLHHWRARFLAQQEKVKRQWGERFFRMWDFYLACCEVAFRTRGLMVFQMQIVRNPEIIPLTRDYIGETEQTFEERNLSSVAATRRLKSGTGV